MECMKYGNYRMQIFCVAAKLHSLALAKLVSKNGPKTLVIYMYSYINPPLVNIFWTIFMGRGELQRKVFFMQAKAMKTSMFNDIILLHCVTIREERRRNIFQ